MTSSIKTNYPSTYKDPSTYDPDYEKNVLKKLANDFDAYPKKDELVQYGNQENMT